MNISRPVASTIEDVSFGILSSQEILRLSVKRISNPQAIDPVLLHPNPNGLYDPALGAILDHPCKTCHLDTNACPGHPGHIELPFNVYHCQYINQAYALLKAQCFNCRRLRIPRDESHRLLFKLKLIRHGLLKQAEELDDVVFASVHAEHQVVNEEDEDSDPEDDADGIANGIAKKEKYTRKQIREAISEGSITNVLTEGAAQARRRVVQTLMAALANPRKCPFCEAYSPGYRKEGAIAIFQKPLKKKQAMKNAQNPEIKLKKIKDPLEEMTTSRQRQSRKLEEEARRKEAQLRGTELHSDEGIADMESSPSEGEVHVFDSPLEDAESLEDSDAEREGTTRNAAEDVMSGRSMIESEPTMAKAKKQRKPDQSSQEVRLPPDEVRARLHQLFEMEGELLGEIYSTPAIGYKSRRSSGDMFFIRHLLIPPNKYRKETKTAPDEISEAADNAPYRQILSACQIVNQTFRDIAEGRRDYGAIEVAWRTLQGRVNALIDVDKGVTRPGQTDKGIKQKLEKKEGVMRMNVMGKRVNFAARSVISPDPNLEANEVGVPPVFAKKLTYPEPVTTHNFAELKQAVINGPEKWPGAVAVEFENGQVINLRRKNIVDRQAIANSLLAPSSATMSGARNKKVLRHLNNGDVVIMNRQPTLHKPSMMAHRAKVLPGEKTIRMHYANTNSYNADFDGDEMNMHFPQNEIARAEAMQIADTDHQYLSTTSGSPLRGLIQDHISIAVWLSSPDMMLTREEYNELLYCALRPENNQTNTERIRTIDPTIWRPAPRWTGKDLITTILENIQPVSYAPLSMRGTCAVPPEQWGNRSEEGSLRIDDNQVLTGCLDKSQIGAKSGGLVHAVYEAYGHVVAGKFVSILGRLLTRLLAVRAFSCGMEDLIVRGANETERKQIIHRSESAGPPAAAQYVSLDDERSAGDSELNNRLEMVTRDDEKLAGLDTVMQRVGKQYGDQISAETVPMGLVKSFPHNQMQTMVQSGAKGGMPNAGRISASLGQQNLEGRRVPIMTSGRTLPSFKAFEPTLRAGGFITDRFLTGVRPQEYYFHSMSGREGLVDTAVKTSRSGYLQRCLIKGLEGCTAGHDGSVRDADGTVIQALYGEDGLEVSQSAKITDFTFIASNIYSYLSKLSITQDNKFFDTNQLNKRDYNKKAEKTYRRTGDLTSSDPALAVYPPTRFLGSTSEAYYNAARDYIEKNTEHKVTDKKAGIQGVTSRKGLELVADFNYLKAVVPPGDAVGVVAGQSLGEPSTQMTLNTFHMAGSAQNVTLGIPRLREILMAATRNIKTPAMTLFFLREVSDSQREVFANAVSKRSIAEVTDSVSVSEQSSNLDQSNGARIYDIELSFFSKGEYSETYSVTPEDIAGTLERGFVSSLDKLVRREFKRLGQAKSRAKVEEVNEAIGKSSGRVEEQPRQREVEAEGGDSDVEDGGDDDATNAKRRQNVDEGRTYDEPDESDEEIERAGEREASPEQGSEDEGYGGSPAASRGSSPHADSQLTTPRRPRQAHSNADARAREQRLKDNYKHLTAFSFNEHDDGPADTCQITLEFPANEPKILLLPLVRKAAQGSLIQEFEGITTATMVKPQKSGEAFYKEGSYVTTAGVNIKKLWEDRFQGIINPNRIYANSVHDMADTFGVECGRECIIQELQSVFSGHGISVDRRHLTLVADYMTRAGTYLPFNRIGMKDDPSVFKKMSFETTVSFLRDSVIEGGKEELIGPSARLTVGALGKTGTGAFDVMLPLYEPDEKEIKKEDEDEQETQEL